jgi:hypothetical protein
MATQKKNSSPNVASMSNNRIETLRKEERERERERERELACLKQLLSL